MIIPEPEGDLRYNVMVLGASIIEELKDVNGYIIVEDLLENFIDEDKKRTPKMFFDTLVFVYTLNIIERDGYKIRLNDKKRNEDGLTQTDLLSDRFN